MCPIFTNLNFRMAQWPQTAKFHIWFSPKCLPCVAPGCLGTLRAAIAGSQRRRWYTNRYMEVGYTAMEHEAGGPYSGGYQRQSLQCHIIKFSSVFGGSRWRTMLFTTYRLRRRLIWMNDRITRHCRTGPDRRDQTSLTSSDMTSAYWIDYTGHLRWRSELWLVQCVSLCQYVNTYVFWS